MWTSVLRRTVAMLARIAQRSQTAVVKIAAVLLAASGATAAVSFSYDQTSTLTASVGTIPVHYVAGADASAEPYVGGFTLSPNATRFSVTLRGVPEATLGIDDLVHLRNADSVAHAVTLTADSVSNAYVTRFTIDFLDEVGTNVGTLDLRSDAPTVAFASLAPGKVLTASVRYSLAAGAGAHNVDVPVAIAMQVS